MNIFSKIRNFFVKNKSGKSITKKYRVLLCIKLRHEDAFYFGDWRGLDFESAESKRKEYESLLEKVKQEAPHCDFTNIDKYLYFKSNEFQYGLVSFKECYE